MPIETYVGVVHKDKGSDYGVSFPEVPGVVTAGESLDDASELAQQALALHLEGMDKEGKPRPKRRGYEWVSRHEDAEGALAFLAVPAPADFGRTMKINISIDSKLLDEIDGAAAAEGTSRSRYLADAAVERMAREGRETPRAKQKRDANKLMETLKKMGARKRA